jgi:hypothetical protein
LNWRLSIRTHRDAALIRVRDLSTAQVTPPGVISKIEAGYFASELTLPTLTDPRTYRFHVNATFICQV